MNLERPDVLVVGAGSAGAAAAAFLAEAGRRVLVVDPRRPEAAGARWANGIPGWCFDEAGADRPAPPECLRPGATYGAVLCNADGTVRIAVPADPLIHVDMPSLVARLQARARAAGAEVLEERVVGVELEGPRVAVVRLAQGRRERLCRPLLTVDASGLAAAVRRRVPGIERFAEPLRPQDVCVAEQGQHAIVDPDGARAFLARHGARPGEAVTFMGRSGGYSVVMAGVDESFHEVAVLAGAIPTDGALCGRALRRAFLAELPWIGAARQAGGAEIPLGPPLLRPAAAGVAVLGDAAHQVFGLHGSGVGLGLIAARHLADAVAEARDPGDPLVLHGYARRFLRTYGGRLAAADVFRRFSQTLSAHDITQLMAEGLVNGRSLSAGLLQAPFGPGALSLGPILHAGLRRPRLLARVASAGARLLAVQRLFAHYPPTPDEAALVRFQQAMRLLSS